MNVKELIEDSLLAEINEVESTLASAKSCLNNTNTEKRDYMQCAVRLQMLGVEFTSLELNIFDEADSYKPNVKQRANVCF